MSGEQPKNIAEIRKMAFFVIYLSLLKDDRIITDNIIADKIMKDRIMKGRTIYWQNHYSGSVFNDSVK